MIDYSLGRFLRDPSVCAQPIEKVDICRQLVTGVKYLHSRVSFRNKMLPRDLTGDFSRFATLILDLPTS